MISARDVGSIYRVPLEFRDEGVDDRILEHFGISAGPANLDEWEALVERHDSADQPVKIGLVGKYTQLEDAYLSVIEALNHAGIHHGAKVEVTLGRLRAPRRRRGRRELAACDGILIPGGFGVRGIEGKIRASRFAREEKVPYLGICLGMQIAVADFARHVVGMEGANSTEFDPETPYPVIDLLPEQKEVRDMGGTMRLGADPVKLHDGTRAREVYGEAVIYERHRHRYEVNNHLRKRLEHAGLVCSGTSPDERLVEVVELPEHPFFVASQFHPEFKSRPLRPQPLFRDFVGAAAERARGPGARGRALGPRSVARCASAAGSRTSPGSARSRVPSGHERPMADALLADLRELGLEPEEDDTGPVTGSDAGNVFARLPGDVRAHACCCAPTWTPCRSAARWRWWRRTACSATGTTPCSAPTTRRRWRRSSAPCGRCGAARWASSCCSPPTRRTGCSARTRSTARGCGPTWASCSTTPPRSAS